MFLVLSNASPEFTILHNGLPLFPLKLPRHMEIWTPPNSSGPPQSASHPNGISISSAIFAWLMIMTKDVHSISLPAGINPRQVTISKRTTSCQVHDSGVVVDHLGTSMPITYINATVFFYMCACLYMHASLPCVVIYLMCYSY